MKLLIVKMSSLGDIVHTFPVIDYLKSHFPDAQIDWVVEQEGAALLKNHPLIRRVLIAKTKTWRRSLFSKTTRQEIKAFIKDLKAESYDHVFDLQGNCKSALPTFLARSDSKIGFGRKTVREWPNLLATNEHFDPPLGQNVRDENLDLVCQKFKRERKKNKEFFESSLSHDQGDQKNLEAIEKLFSTFPTFKVLLSVGSNWKNKQLSLKTIQEFMEEFLKRKEAHFFFVWGNEKEKELLVNLQNHFQRETSLLPKMSLPLLQKVMGQVDLILAMDSLVLHLAGTTSTPSYGFFGPSSGLKYSPNGKLNSFYQGKCPYDVTFERRCPKLRSCPTGACMKELKGKEILDDLFFLEF